MRFLLGLGVVLLLACAGVGVAFYSGALSMSEPSDAASATPPPTPRPAPAAVPAGSAAAPAAAPAAPATPPPTVINKKAFGDWVYSCLAFADGKTECSISQQLSDIKSKQPVFLWRIAQDGKGGLVGIWQTPTGVLVNRGIVLDAGTPKPIAIPFEYCGQGGCEATGNLAADFLDSLSKAQKASATIYTRGAKGLTFPLSVKGLSDGLAELKK